MKMKGIKWIFLIFAVLSAASMMGIGIAIAEKSMIGVMSSIIALIFIMGLGFKTKRRMRESGEL
jgi:ABC-type nitrate/sulfonate/bicarbonate transport system permease component